MTIRWDILIYTLIISSGMATFLAVTVRDLRGIRSGAVVSTGLALILTSAGLILKCMQYGRPERIFRVLGNPTSTIAMELIFISIAIVLMILYIVISLRGSSNLVRLSTALVCVLVTSYAIICSGAVYYLPARPAWHTIMVPIVYLISSVAVGLTLVMIIADDEDSSRILQICSGIFVLSILGYVVAVVLAPFPDSSRSVVRLVSGDLSLYFYLSIIGAILPAIILQVLKINRYILIALLLSSVIASILIRASIYAMGTSIQQYIY